MYFGRRKNWLLQCRCSWFSIRLKFNRSKYFVQIWTHSWFNFPNFRINGRWIRHYNYRKEFWRKRYPYCICWKCLECSLCYEISNFNTNSMYCTKNGLNLYTWNSSQCCCYCKINLRKHMLRIMWIHLWCCSHQQCDCSSCFRVR